MYCTYHTCIHQNTNDEQNILDNQSNEYACNFVSHIPQNEAQNQFKGYIHVLSTQITPNPTTTTDFQTPFIITNPLNEEIGFQQNSDFGTQREHARAFPARHGSGGFQALLHSTIHLSHRLKQPHQATPSPFPPTPQPAREAMGLEAQESAFPSLGNVSHIDIWLV